MTPLTDHIERAAIALRISPQLNAIKSLERHWNAIQMGMNACLGNSIM